ncbi:retrovirus-related Pol polyprotein from transposon opus [Trichonephila clavata]|uniref:Retrovirus-related Pol polyprotein from transposon opus n=1 Tax=Trichonephila clavata TaxID=2740835 RepID=A0A8X6FN30_TRICU|nr:retrovirus-related Pol polyprotein from transposon opus [Trichonephila clavata]
MFAYREVAHSTTGVSPYQLVYGLLPNGPLKLLKEVWTGDKEIPTGSSKSIEEYLRDLTEKLKQAHNLARGNSEKAQAEYASRYNLRSREKQLPIPHTARVKLEDGGRRELHCKKLRPYIARVGQVGLIFDQDSNFGDLHYAPTDTAVTSMVDFTDYISRDCQELDDFQ